MIAFLSALLGFGSSILPEFFKGFQDKRDKEHELAMLRVQAEMEARRATADLDKTIAQAVAAQNVAVQESYRADIAALSGGNEEGSGDGKGKDSANNGSWIIAYSASVRPTITYAFFLLYALVKFSQFWLLVHPALPWQQAMTAAAAIASIWTDEDIAIFSAVIAFWFGDRMLRARRAN